LRSPLCLNSSLSMIPRTKFARPFLSYLGAVVLLIALAIAIHVDAYRETIIRASTDVGKFNVRSALLAPVVDSSPAMLSPQGRVTRYFMGLEGDRSLNAAMVIEQMHSGFIRYSVGLRLASGAEQWIALIAPPGGLRLEMRDMTGDNVPNDLVVTPALLHWPLAVVLKDGHDHFSVTISANFPGAWGSGGNRASKTRDAQCSVLLIPSRFRTPSRTNAGTLFPPQVQENSPSAIAHMAPMHLASPSGFGRAPPALITKI
jgi:hypothetical protein